MMWFVLSAYCFWLKLISNEEVTLMDIVKYIYVSIYYKFFDAYSIDLQK